MKHWARAGAGVFCGLCGLEQVADDLVLVLEMGLRRPKYRCVTCAGERAPADVPLFETAAKSAATKAIPAPSTMVRFTSDMVPEFKRQQTPFSKAMLPNDWKKRQSGDE